MPHFIIDCSEDILKLHSVDEIIKQVNSSAISTELFYKNDIVTVSAITNAIKQIATTDKADMTDFFSETGKNVKVYEGMKKELASNPELAQQLSDTNLDPSEKEKMLNTLATTVMTDLGYIANNTKVISTDETGRDNTKVKGHFNTNTNYINDKNNKDTQELVATTGHEITHAMDKQDNIFKAGDKDQNVYADNFGDNLASYTNAALDYTSSTNLATTNQHTKPKSLEAYLELQQNNEEFKGLDKGVGDDRKIETVTLYGEDDGRYIRLKKHIDVSYETTIPEMFSRALERPKFRKKVKTEVLNAAGVVVAVGGAFATGGLSYGFYGAGVALDGYSVYENQDLTYGLGMLLIPDTGRIGSVISTINAINNSYLRDNND